MINQAAIIPLIIAACAIAIIAYCHGKVKGYIERDEQIEDEREPVWLNVKSADSVDITSKNEYK